MVPSYFEKKKCQGFDNYIVRFTNFEVNASL